jgi:hypothetical protein
MLNIALLASLFAACSPAPLLNSERIQQRFGSYGVELLRQDGALRVACLYSEEPTGRVCRTVAVTLLDVPPPELAAESAAINAGASIGATLKAAGWTVTKRDHVVVERETGPGFAALLHWPPQESPPRVAVDLYALWAERSGEIHRFARIAEAHHPDYLDLAALRKIVPRDAMAPASLDVRWPDMTAALDAVMGQAAR